MAGAGLTFYNIPEGASASFRRMAIIFFTMLLFELLPFCYMSFYVFDRKFFMADRAADLYYTSAYYVAHTTASESSSLVNQCLLSFQGFQLQFDVI